MPLKDPRIKKLDVSLPDKVKVYLVDGDIIRNEYGKDGVEFSLGGNHERYSFVPDDEIWVENTENEHDIEANIYHECHERLLMKYKGLSYNDAHNQASLKERQLRQERVPISDLIREIADKLQKTYEKEK